MLKDDGTLFHISRVCKIPQAATILEYGNQEEVRKLPECKTAKSYFAMLNFLTTAGYLSKNTFSCLPSCATSSFKTTVFEIDAIQPKFPNASVCIVAQYLTTGVTHYEEYLLLDFIAIVAAVGGALGLFVGFSFFDCAKYFVDKFSRD